MRHATAALALLALAACGGGGGASPTGSTPASAPSPQASGWPVGTIVQLVDGATGQSIAYSFTVGGATANAGEPLRNPAAPGATVDVSLLGFLDRQTVVRTGETRLVLWPDSASLPSDYTRMLVYTSSGAPGSGTLEAMRRPSTRVRTVAVVPSSELQANPDAMEAHRAAIEGVNAASAPVGLTYLLGGTGDLNVPTRVDPTASTCVMDPNTRAFTSLFMSNASEITRAEIVFCAASVSTAAGTIAHELGHVFGLRHSLDSHDLMYPYLQSSRSQVPTARETLTMSLMRARRAGTVWPDNDRDSTAAAGGRFVIVVD